MIQSINLENPEAMNIDSKEIEILQLNGKELWCGVGLDLNYTGLDVNCNVEGSLKFDGTIVAYAVGKPTITITTAEDGTQTENITYSSCNGYNSEYYGGYDFTTSIAVSETPYNENQRIVPEVLKIPSTYNGKPVTQVLQSAFYGGKIDSSTSELTAYNQGIFIKDIVWGNNLQRLGAYAFYGLCYYGILDSKTTFYLPSLEAGLFGMTTDTFAYLGKFNENLTNLVVPENSSGYSLGSSFTGVRFKLATYKCSSVTDIVSCDTVVFEKTVTELKPGMMSTNIPSNMKFLHADEDVFTNNITSNKSASSTNIYADKEDIVAFDWESANINATRYHLDGTLWNILDKPTISIDETILTITPVENATTYKIFMKDGASYTLLKEVSETTVDLSDVAISGSIEIVVRASADGYCSSAYSNVVNLLYNQLEAPTITLSSDGDYLSITAVENADQYKVYISAFSPASEHFSQSFVTSDTNVFVGSYQQATNIYVQVCALDSTGVYMKSFPSNEVMLPINEDY